MAIDLSAPREELKEILHAYSKDVGVVKTEDELLRDEAEYAATGLKSNETTTRAKAVEFLEILGENPYAQDYLLIALEDKEGIIVQKAIHALGKVANKDVVPKLHEFMKTTRSKHIVSEIGRVLAKIDRKG
jgi:HEAT repeat protein